MKRPVRITLDDVVRERIQAFADENGLSLSSAISILASQQLKQEEAVVAVKELSGLWDKVRKIKEIDGIDVVPTGAPDIDIDWKK